ncbi:MAG: hypothetical protein CV089_17490 [Nitrospira sp. WS110]|nr:hypothetical protein [Nitrospira sp. WS110]
MLFERQRLILTLLNALDGPIGHMDFQKLLFLYTKECEEKPSYEFVPYRFGGFSFTSYADKRRLIEGGLLEEDEQHWQLSKAGRLEAIRRPVSPELVSQFCRQHAGLRGNELIAEIYRHYPYYATRSEIVDKVLPDAESRRRVEEAASNQAGPALLTIGYEGKCLERYLNQLLQAGVTLLCDVRRNPLSRKYGFSKATLSNACEGVGIRYEHLPELGIDSDKRRNLETQNDYDALFATYEREYLPGQHAALDRIRRWLVSDQQRVALTCFEELPQQCHRHCVAKVFESSGDGRLEPVHL